MLRCNENQQASAVERRGFSVRALDTLEACGRVQRKIFFSRCFLDGSMDEEKMDGSHLTVTCQVACEKPIPTYALIDNGATGYAFIDKDFACHHHLLQLPLKKPVVSKSLMAAPSPQEKLPTTLKQRSRSMTTLKKPSFTLRSLATTPSFSEFHGFASTTCRFDF